MSSSTNNPGPPPRYRSTRSSSVFRTGLQRFERPVFDYPAKFSPCRAACPAAHDIALAMLLAASDRFDLAFDLFRQESPFPGITGRVCYHPCEAQCNRAEYDDAIAINALERALDAYGASPSAPAQVCHPETVGVVGAGPAGLTCAYHLARLGYAVTVYDANPSPGGMLAYGIPEYRLPSEVVARAVEDLQALGVAFRCGVRVGQDIPFAELRHRHEALFLAPGLQRPSPLKPCLDLPEQRSLPGLEFLRRVRQNGRVDLSGATVLVIGGGDVAVDAARTALRAGAASVTICCPESRDEMPAHPQEIRAALSEGIAVANCIAPEGGRISGSRIALSFRAVEAVKRGDGAVSFALSDEPPTDRLADHVIYAVGQQPDLGFLPEELRCGPRIECGPFGQTGVAGVFAGGDAAGTYNVVNAIGSAKRAAIGIDAYLRGTSLDGIEAHIAVGPGGPVSMQAYIDLRSGLSVTPAATKIGLGQINLSYFSHSARCQLPVAENAQADFREVNLTLQRLAARAEASRCFNCGLCNMCGNCFAFCPDSAVIRRDGWGFRVDLDHCKGCGVCVEECPRGAMSMIPEGKAASHGD